jgi:hemerythrin superfamily protein
MATKQSAKRAATSAGSRAKKASGTAKKAARSAATGAAKTQKRATRKSAPAVKKATKKVAATRKTTKVAAKGAKRVGRAGGSSKRSSRSAQRDAIAVLKDDHREVEQLFKRFEKAGDGADKAKRRLVDSMLAKLSVHAGIEEVVFYPAVRQAVDGVDSDVLEALEEHHLVKVVLRELEGMAPSDERFDAKVTVMIENVRHHVKEEEGELFPTVRKQLNRSRLVDLGQALRDARRRVPDRPHPGAPDEPPANAIVGSATAVIDRARSVGKSAVERVREEVPVL